MGDNPLTTLPAGAFSGLSALTELDLVGNPLDTSAITLLAGLPATVTAITDASGGICTRTKEVRNAIVRNINGVTNCASVTMAQLAAITFWGLGLESSGITALKAGDFAGLSALTRLNLRNNQITTLPTGAFSGLSALTRLNLGDNQISTLPTGAFSGLSALTALDLHDNQISTLPAGAFSGLSALTRLYLGDNQISTLPTGAFSGLSALTRLDLDNNQISTLPTGAFSGLSALTRLDLDNNQISTLPTGAFSGLSALTELDLVGNPLDTSAITLLAGLPATVTAITDASGGICTRTKEVRNAIVRNINGVTNCASVTMAQLAAITFWGLGLESSGITALKAGDFAGLSALTRLNLRNNQITTLPTGAFSGLSALTRLNLGDNQISTLPTGAFSGLSALTALDLRNNQITTLPAGAFSGLSALTELNLGDNPLDTSAITLLAGLPATVTAITDASGGICTRTKEVRNAIVRNINGVTNCASVTMAQLAAITSLDLESSGITALKAGDFAGLSALTRLYLGDNQVSTLPAGAFTGLSALTFLYLHDNQVSTLPAGAFSGLSALTALDLHDNPLTTLPAGAFSGLSALTLLSLGNNQISTLPAGAFSGLSALTRLGLAGNPLDAAATMLLAGLPSTINVITNSAPFASAGADATVTKGATVTLDGSASSDLEGGTLAYSWTHSHTGITLSGETTAMPTFTAPDQLLTDVVLTFSLVVNDGTNNSQPDTVTITVVAATMAAALTKISAYAADDSSPAPTLMDYIDAGVTGVTSINLAIVNTAVLASTGTEADTTVKIQALATAAIDAGRLWLRSVPMQQMAPMHLP